MIKIPRLLLRLATAVLLPGLLSACATRPINPRLERIVPSEGYRSTAHAIRKSLHDTEILITFSGGGMRAAAFAFGVLEELRRQELEVRGARVTLLNEVDLISGVSGGGFTALAYGLYGDRLFDGFADQFLKRDVQGELLKRIANPANWPKILSTGVGRSELAADYYDEILFHGATFGDLIPLPGPLVIAGSTDISTGARLAFAQRDWDIICSDLSAVRLSRAAAATSAVPVVLSPVTINNYGGTCGYRYPAWVDTPDPEAAAAVGGRLLQRQAEMRSFEQSTKRPYLHLVDGGIADNLGLRPILERFRATEVSPEFRRQLGIENVRRTLIIVVNSRSDPRTDWDQSESGPSALSLALQSVNLPIDHNSFEALEILKDVLARWNNAWRILKAADGTGAPSGVSRIRLYPVVVSFDLVSDDSLRARLMALPTSFSLSAEDVDMLRGEAGSLLRRSPEFKAFLKDLQDQ